MTTSSASRATANLGRSSHVLLLGKRSHESDFTHDAPSLRPITHRWGLLTCSCLSRPPVSRTGSTPRRASLLRLSSADRGSDEHPAKRPDQTHNQVGGVEGGADDRGDAGTVP